MSLLSELRKRNVFRTALAYLAASWLLIQVVETLFPVFGIADAYVRGITILLAIGFIPVLVFSWAFGITADGIRRNSDVDPAAPASARWRRTLGQIALVAVTLAVVVFAIERFVFSQLKPQDLAASRASSSEGSGVSRAAVNVITRFSIGVLPFSDLSPSRDNAYFSDGIAEDLLNLLARIPQLKVAARTSSFSFRDQDVDVRQIGEALRVAHVLEGSVRKSGDRIRITAQLVDTRTGYQRWADTFDEKIENVFALQERIARKITAALKLELLGELPEVASTAPEAYAKFLQSRHFLRQRTAEGVSRAESLLLEAIDLDPGYAPAWTQLAITYIEQASKSIRPIAEGHVLARDAVDQALAIDPLLADALAAKAWILMIHDWNFREADRLLQKAVALSPQHPMILNTAATIANNFGRHDESIRLYGELVRVNPISSTAWNNLAYAYYYEAGRKTLTRKQPPESVPASPGFPLALCPHKGFSSLGNTLGIPLDRKIPCANKWLPEIPSNR